jgi:ABC-2 type transport system ATP-binding protein
VESVVSIHGLRKRYGQFEAVAGIDLEVQRGEIFAFLGPNGAGKTTTVEILEGFRTRTEGEVSVLGVDPAKGDASWRNRVGAVLQESNAEPGLTVRESLRLYSGYYLHPRDIDETIALVGLEEKAETLGTQLSGGQRRRLDVAIGIVGRPELLFLDEPTAGFDPEARREFHDLVHALSDQNTTILLTTHDLDEAEKLADRILILAGGTIIADGSADELARRMSTEAEVRWTVDGQRFVHSTSDATAFVRQLFHDHGEQVEDLEVRRASLEDTYVAMVRQFESGSQEQAVREFEVLSR